MKYVVKEKKLIDAKYELDLSLGYVASPKFKDIEIKKVTLYDSNLIDFYISKNFLRNYQKVLKIVMMTLSEEEPSDEAVDLSLGEVEKLEAIILNKYKKHLHIEKVKKMLKELYLLNQELKKKREMMYNYINTSNRSR